MQDEAPWGEDGETASFDICRCCGTTFGYQDGLVEAVKKTRQLWQESGMVWFHPEEKPIDWCFEDQAINNPIKYR